MARSSPACPSMKTSFIIVVGSTITSAAHCRVVTAFVALVTMTHNTSGFARTVGPPAGANKGSSASPMANAVLTLRCGCCKCDKNKKRVAEFVFGEKNNGTLVKVPRGSKITVELKENPTTGYKWTLVPGD